MLKNPLPSNKKQEISLIFSRMALYLLLYYYIGHSKSAKCVGFFPLKNVPLSICLFV